MTYNVFVGTLKVLNQTQSINQSIVVKKDLRRKGLMQEEVEEAALNRYQCRRSVDGMDAG